MAASPIDRHIRVVALQTFATRRITADVKT
jgi:hypothetical protein